jgi:hypothetical protein
VRVLVVATPVAFVTAVLPLAKLPLAPPAPAVIEKVTVTFGTGFPPASVTVAWSAVGNGVAIRALWLLPAAAVTVVGVPTVLVRLNVAGVAPLTAAVTVKAPTLPLAVRVPAIATPELFVTAVLLPAKLAVAPVAPVPTVKVTVTPETALPPASVTVACNTVGNAALIEVL